MESFLKKFSKGERCDAASIEVWVALIQNGNKRLFQELLIWFSVAKGQLKLDLVMALAQILVYKNALNNEYVDGEMYLRKGMVDLLSDVSVPEVYRDAALVVTDYAVQQFGMDWSCSGDSFFSKGNFVVLYTKLASVELKLLLDVVEDDFFSMNAPPNTKREQLSKEQLVIVQRVLNMTPVAYSILEQTIRILMTTDGEKEILPDATLLLLQDTFQQVIPMVLQFLVLAKDFVKTHYFMAASDSFISFVHSIIYTTIRFLGAWIAEESDVFQDTLMEIVPFLLTFQPSLSYSDEPLPSFSKLSIVHPNESPDSDDEVDQEPEQLQHELPISMDPMSFLLPGMLQISATSDVASTIASSMPAQQRLLQYIVRLCLTITTENQPSMDIISMLTMAVSTVLNVVCSTTLCIQEISNNRIWQKTIPILHSMSIMLHDELEKPIIIDNDNDHLLLLTQIVALLLSLPKSKQKNLSSWKLTPTTLLSFSKVVESICQIECSEDAELPCEDTIMLIQYLSQRNE